MVSRCQLAGGLDILRSWCCVSAKLPDMRGQKVGKGQRVKIKVNASAWPLKSLKLTAWPSSFVKWYSGIGSPSCNGSTSRTRRKLSGAAERARDAVNVH